jgi:hypothetical protein
MSSPDPGLREGALVVRCAWCGRIEVTPTTWVEPVRLLAPDETTDGICPECFDEQLDLRWATALF